MFIREVKVCKYCLILTSLFPLLYSQLDFLDSGVERPMILNPAQFLEL